MGRVHHFFSVTPWRTVYQRERRERTFQQKRQILCKNPRDRNRDQNLLTMRKNSILAILRILRFLSRRSTAVCQLGRRSRRKCPTGAFKPSHRQVEMLKEDCHKFYRDRQVEIDYVLHNTGDAIDVKQPSQSGSED